MHTETNAIILNVTTYKESDIVATLLSENLGKVRCLARSAKKSKHRFFSGVEMLDVGVFHLSKKSTFPYQIENISGKQSILRKSLDPLKFLHACLYSEIFNACIPEEDSEYGELVKSLKKAVFFLEKSENSIKTNMISCWIISKLALFSGIDPRSSKDYFRADDMNWIQKLCEDKFLTYEPEAASNRTLLSLVNFIEDSFDLKSKVIKQIKI